MEFILAAGRLTVDAFHGGDAGHGIFAADAYTENEERNGVHNDPAVEGCAPHSCEKDGPEEHGCCILNDAPSSADPITNDSDHDLAADDANNLEIVDSLDPDFAADFAADLVLFVALRPHRLKQTEDVSDGEENITFTEEAKTGDDKVSEIKGEWLQRIIFEDVPHDAELS